MAADSWLNKRGNIIRDVAVDPCRQHQTCKNISTLSLLLAAPYPNSLPFLPITWLNSRHPIMWKHVNTWVRSRHVPQIMGQGRRQMHLQHTMACDGGKEGAHSVGVLQ